MTVAGQGTPGLCRLRLRRLGGRQRRCLPAGQHHSPCRPWRSPLTRCCWNAAPASGLSFNPTSGSTITASTPIYITVNPPSTAAVYWNTAGFPLKTSDHLYQNPGFYLSVSGTVYAAVYNSQAGSWFDQASADYVVAPATVPVTGVSLSKTRDTIGVDGVDTLTATISPSNATDQDVTWSDDNTGVATISQAA